MTVRQRIQESAVSVVASDFANDAETIAGLRKRTHAPKPGMWKAGRRKLKK